MFKNDTWDAIVTARRAEMAPWLSPVAKQCPYVSPNRSRATPERCAMVEGHDIPHRTKEGYQFEEGNWEKG